MTGPLSRPVDVRSLPAKGYREAVEPNEAERASLVMANDLLELNSFKADVRIEPWGADGVRVAGRIAAQVTQRCVVSLEPVSSAIDEPFDAILVPEGSPLARADDGEVVLDGESDDLPETFVPPVVDIGGVVSEFFTLALDPYPRAPGASLPAAAGGAVPNPFAMLRALKLGGETS